MIFSYRSIFRFASMKKLLSIIVLILSAQQVFAWGQTGHRVVGLIAESHLCSGDTELRNGHGCRRHERDMSDLSATLALREVEHAVV